MLSGYGGRSGCRRKAEESDAQYWIDVTFIVLRWGFGHIERHCLNWKHGSLSSPIIAPSTGWDDPDEASTQADSWHPRGGARPCPRTTAVPPPSPEMVSRLRGTWGTIRDALSVCSPGSAESNCKCRAPASLDRTHEAAPVQAEIATLEKPPSR